MSKEIPREMIALFMKLEVCQKCNEQLIHDYYTEEEAKSKKMDLNFRIQRNSYCKKCRILYINNK